MIDPQEVVEAYRKTGLKPARGGFNHEEHDNECCALGVLRAVGRIPTQPMRGYIAPAAEAFFDGNSEHAWAFVDGFDNNLYGTSYDYRKDTPGCREAWENGRTVALFVLREIGLPA